VGGEVVLEKLPPGLIDGLPKSDQEAIAAIVGVPIQFLGYEEDGRIGLEFVDDYGIFHHIYVDRQYVKAIKPGPGKLTKRRK
jgi:hypothetical protein